MDREAGVIVDALGELWVFLQKLLKRECVTVEGESLRLVETPVQQLSSVSGFLL
jgi:hypothetical protein